MKQYFCSYPETYVSDDLFVDVIALLVTYTEHVWFGFLCSMRKLVQNRMDTARIVLIPAQFSQVPTMLILDLHPANERRRYKVTPSLIGLAQT